MRGWGRLIALFGPLFVVPVSTVFAQSSVLDIPVTVSLNNLLPHLEAAIPTELVNQPAQRQICVPAQWASLDVPVLKGNKLEKKRVRKKISPDIACDLSSRVWRTGKVQLRAEGVSIVATADFAGQATVRGRGTIGKHIQETANGILQVVLSFTPTLSADWQSRLDELRDQALENLEAQLKQISVRQEAAKRWREAQHPIAVVPEENLFLMVRPKQIGLSSLLASDESISMVFQLEADTRLSLGRPMAGEILPLPSLQRITPGDSGLQLSVPAKASFKALNEMLRKKVRRPLVQTLATPFGTLAQLSVWNPQVKDNGDGEILVDVNAQVEGLVGESGPLRLHLIARPTLDAESHRFLISLTSTEIIEGKRPNFLLRMALRLLTSRIASSFEIDFGDDWDQLTSQLRELEEIELEQGIALNADFEKLEFRDFTIADTGISIVADVQGKAEIELTP